MEKAKKVFITVDNTIEDVVKYNEEGIDVFFCDDVDRMIELSKEDLKLLPKALVTRYNISKQTHELRTEQAKEDALIAQIELGSRAANASGQLEIQNKDPNYEYYLSARRNVGKKKQKGFQIDKTGATCYGITPTNGVKFVGYSDELVIMSRPKELAEERQQRRKELITKQFGDWMEATGMDYKE